MAAAATDRPAGLVIPSPLYWTGIAELKGRGSPPAAFSWPDAGPSIGLKSREAQMPGRNGLISTAELAEILGQADLRLFDGTTYLEPAP